MEFLRDLKIKMVYRQEYDVAADLRNAEKKIKDKLSNEKV